MTSTEFNLQRAILLAALKAAGQTGLDSGEIRDLGVGNPTKRMHELKGEHWIVVEHITGHTWRYWYEGAKTAAQKAQERQDAAARLRYLAQHSRPARWAQLDGKYGQVKVVNGVALFITHKGTAYAMNRQEVHNYAARQKDNAQMALEM